MRQMEVVPDGALWQIQCKWWVRERFIRMQDDVP